MEMLAAAGVALESVRPVEPSLEDVFVSVLAGTNGVINRAAAPSAP